MKYEKATAIIIDLGEEDIITASSGCTTVIYQTEDTCTGGNHKGKYSECTNNGHRNGL